MRNAFFKLNICTFLMIAIALFACDSTWGQGKGGGKGGGGGGSDPPPDPPPADSPLKYHLSMSEIVFEGTVKIPNINDVNIHGVAVGRVAHQDTLAWEATLYDPNGVLGALLGEPNRGAYRFHELFNDLPTEWPESSFRAINDSGQIVGTFYDSLDASSGSRSFIVELFPTPTWRYLPNPEGYQVHSVRAINELGIALVNYRNLGSELWDRIDLVNTFDNDHSILLKHPNPQEVFTFGSSLNNLNQVRVVANGIAYRATLDLQLEVSGLEVLPAGTGGSGIRMSDAGTLHGAISETTTVRKKTTTIERAARVWKNFETGENELDVFGPDDTFTTGINSEGDILVWKKKDRHGGFTGLLFTNVETPNDLDMGPFIEVADLIVVEEDDKWFWDGKLAARATAISNRDSSGFGKIAGVVADGSHTVYTIFVLTPEVTSEE